MIAKQGSFREDEISAESGPVECLGKTFDNDAARRSHFIEALRERLKDPTFRKTPGFPIGTDDDILRLSDPPYYTACPNPFLQDLVLQFGKAYDAQANYRREPFAADVSEGKNDPIYNAHSYHTKVPHKAIMRYVLHYTEPGDLVFDGFCGTGMAGVAAKLCGDRSTLASLGYTLTADGGILDENQNLISRSGSRIPILNDLSPAATLIAAGYNLTTHADDFPVHANRLLAKFNQEFGWMYQTHEAGTNNICSVDFTVWSEIFSCPDCSGEIDYWELAYDEESGKIDDLLTCPHCSVELAKRALIRRTTTYFDKALQETRSRQVLRPVEIHYQRNGEKKTKKPDSNDLATLERAEQLLDSLSYPTELFMFVPEGTQWGDLFRGYHEGISRAHDFFLSRQLAAFSLLWKNGDDLPSEELKRLWRFTLQSILVSFTRRIRRCPAGLKADGLSDHKGDCFGLGFSYGLGGGGTAFGFVQHLVRLCSAQHKVIYVAPQIMLCRGLRPNIQKDWGPSYTT